jgi:hypothetical protein
MELGEACSTAWMAMTCSPLSFGKPGKPLSAAAMSPRSSSPDLTAAPWRNGAYTPLSRRGTAR